MIELVREFVECESPSDDAAAVRRFVDLVADRLTPIAEVRRPAGGHLTAKMRLPGRKKNGRILVLGHSDTVWPLGTLRTMRFRRVQGRLWGPGVFDMKAGIVF